mmetsp:Transcript_9480/g.13235  ORF Transcript_9480/g.13235 Transcript_9480/m.13235 type:complete len:269 (+) Transcript_9480:112-918(+)
MGCNPSLVSKPITFSDNDPIEESSEEVNKLYEPSNDAGEPEKPIDKEPTSVHENKKENETREARFRAENKLAAEQADASPKSRILTKQEQAAFFKKGMVVRYKDREDVTIAGIHHDDPTEIYFTVRKMDGVEVNTVFKYLRKKISNTADAPERSRRVKGTKANPKEHESLDEARSANLKSHSGLQSRSNQVDSPVASLRTNLEASDKKFQLESLNFNHTLPMDYAQGKGSLYPYLESHTDIVLVKNEAPRCYTGEHRPNRLNVKPSVQ